MVEKNKKYVDIILTDIKFHIAKPRKPLSPERAITKSLRNKKPGRIIKRNIPVTKDGIIQLPILENNEIKEIKEKYEKEGKTVRFFMPKKGLDMFIDKNTSEYIKARKKKLTKK